MAETTGRLGQLDDLSIALADIEEKETTLSRPEIPVYVDPEITGLPTKAFLSQDDIAKLANAPVRSPRYSLYMAWRRFAVLRLYAQGLKFQEIADTLGISYDVARRDYHAVRQEYEGVASRDWALIVEDRVMRLDQDIYELRRLVDTLPDRMMDNGEDLISIGPDIDQRLRILDRIMSLEDKRDKLLGIDKAASAQYEPTRKLKVELSFEQNTSVQPSYEMPAIEVGDDG